MTHPKNNIRVVARRGTPPGSASNNNKYIFTGTPGNRPPPPLSPFAVTQNIIIVNTQQRVIGGPHPVAKCSITPLCDPWGLSKTVPMWCTRGGLQPREGAPGVHVNLTG